MKRIIHRYTYYNRTNTQHYYRNHRLEYRYDTQCKQAAKQYRRAYPQQVATTSERQNQDNKNQYHSKRHSNKAVTLYLLSIGDGNQWCSHCRDFNSVNLLFGFGNGNLNHLGKSLILHRLTYTIRRQYKRKSLIPFFIENISSCQLVIVTKAIKRLHFTQHRREKFKRVISHAPSHHATSRQHQGTFSRFELSRNIPM